MIAHIIHAVNAGAQTLLVRRSRVGDVGATPKRGSPPNEPSPRGLNGDSVLVYRGQTASDELAGDLSA